MDKMFPIQREHGRKPTRPYPRMIPWSIAELAYGVYSSRYSGQTLEQLAARGGFGPGEMDDLCPDWLDRCNEITILKAELELAQAAGAEILRAAEAGVEWAFKQMRGSAARDIIRQMFGLLQPNPGQAMVAERDEWKARMKLAMNEAYAADDCFTPCEASECGGCEDDESVPCEKLAKWVAHALETIAENKAYDAEVKSKAENARLTQELEQAKAAWAIADRERNDAMSKICMLMSRAKALLSGGAR